MLRIVAVAALAMLLAGCCPCPTGTPTPAPTVTPTYPPAATATPRALAWDSRLDALHVRVEYVPGARYQLVAAFMTINGSWDNTPRDPFWQWVDKATGGGGDHHMFVGVYKADGSPLAGKTAVFYKGNMTPDALVTDERGWANGVCQDAYFPDKGETGAYALQPLNGDKLIGGGLPYGNHVSVFGVWREVAPTALTLWQVLEGWLWPR